MMKDESPMLKLVQVAERRSIRPAATAIKDVVSKESNTDINFELFDLKQWRCV